MDIVKKNILSIICGVIILLAIVSLFWPIAGMRQNLKDQLEKRTKVYDQFETLRKKTRAWPVVDLEGESTTGQKLDQFPGDKVIEHGEKVTHDLAEQSKAMLDTALAINLHKPLVEGVLPKTTDPGPILSFREKYREMIQHTIPEDVLHSTTPPTEEEIDKAMDKLWNDKYVQKFVYVNEKPVNEDKVNAEYLAEIATMPKRIRDERANKYLCYVDEGAISISEVMASDGRTPSLGEVWYAQSSLWVQQDLANSIARVNSDKKSVSDARVKHIKLLSVAPNIGQYLRPGMSLNGAPMPMASASAEPPPAADPNAPLPKDFNLSPTGRICNNMYDVIQWNMKVVVEAAEVPTLLAEISREKHFFSKEHGAPELPSTFATVTKMDIAGVDNALAFEQGFVYGDRPIVELTLQGESIFLRSWTVPLMPPTVKQELNIEPAADAAKASANAG